LYLEIALIAFIIDRIFGEFKYIKHPVVFMGDFIKWYEKRYYKDDVLYGVYLTLSLLFIVFCITFTIEYFIDNIFVLGIIASTGVASKMLYDSVKDIIKNPENIKYLVSRDTKELSVSDINKAAIETYGENLSDGVIAPLFYLMLFGIVGLFLYKAVNTLDSMVGYKNTRYEKFGKFSAKLDDVLNYIPSRITAFLIGLLFFSLEALKKCWAFGKLHESPNAGYPISAIGFSIAVRLGGSTSYFGKIKEKPYFSEGVEKITTNHIEKALSFRKRLDIFVLLFLIVLIFR